jgi:hypothetical protein
MTDLRKAAEMALEVLLKYRSDDAIQHYAGIQDSITFLRQALSQPEQEPVAWLWKNIDGHQVLTDDPDYADGTWTPLYTAPPKREWVGLTDADKQEAFDETQEASGGFWEFADYLDAKLKEKNGG